jgi:hypothetical protein
MSLLFILGLSGIGLRARVLAGASVLVTRFGPHAAYPEILCKMALKWPMAGAMQGCRKKAVRGKTHGPFDADQRADG